VRLGCSDVVHVTFSAFPADDFALAVFGVSAVGAHPFRVAFVAQVWLRPAESEAFVIALFTFHSFITDWAIRRTIISQ
jgi:hypothetical protein